MRLICTRQTAFAALCLVAALAIAPSVASAQCAVTQSSPTFPNPTGSVFGSLAATWKQYFAAKVDANGGTLCNPVISGAIIGGAFTNPTINGGVIAGATITDLAAPLPANSGGTASTSLGPEFTTTGGSGNRFDIVGGGVTSSMLASGTANAVMGTNGSGAWSAMTTLPSALTIPSPTITGGSITGTSIDVTAVGGAVSATLAARFGHILNAVDDYGADPTGTVDATADIITGLAASPHLYFPCGTYRIASTATISLTTGDSIIGASPGCVTFVAHSAAVPAFTLGDHVSGITVWGFTLDRDIAGTAGGFGINSPSSVSDVLLGNLIVQNQYVGITLSTTDVSWVWHVLSQNNYSDGVQLNCNPANPQTQWNMDTVHTQENNGVGFVVSASATGCTNMTLGDMRFLTSFANTGGGLAVNGAVNGPETETVNDIRIHHSFFGQDGGAAELSINSYGKQIAIDDSNVELAGQGQITGSCPGGCTGRNLATPVTGNTTIGIQLTANNPEVSIRNTRINGSNYENLVSNATLLIGTDIESTNAGVAAHAGNESGIRINAGTAHLTGGVSGNTVSSGGTQSVGVANVGGTVTVSGIDLPYNSSSPTSGTVNGVYTMNGLSTFVGPTSCTGQPTGTMANVANTMTVCP